MMMRNFKKSSMGNWLMMSKTDVTEAVLSLEVFHGGAKFIDANHNQLWHIPADSFFSAAYCFLESCSTRTGRWLPRGMGLRWVTIGLERRRRQKRFVWRDYIRLKFSSSVKKIQPFPVFLEKLQIRIDENQDSNRMLEIWVGQ